MKMLAKIVSRDPEITVGDVAFFVGALTIAVVFGYVGIVGVLNYEDGSRRVIPSVGILIVAAAAAYVFITGTGYLIDECMTRRKH